MHAAPPTNSTSGNAYIVGGGIAGLAAAVLLIRDGGWAGDRIHVFERSQTLGGSLDGAGDPDTGYVIRGGRMFEAHFGCTYDLFRSIPALADPAISVTDEIHAFSRAVITRSKCRLVSGHEKQEAPPLGLGAQDKWDLVRLALWPEYAIGPRTIEDYFRAQFFATNFWLMWCTMFAFQPWHSLVEFRRYLRRFIHLLPGFSCLEGIQRTPLNQYDSLVLPTIRWLHERGAHLHTGTAVTDIQFSTETPPARITHLGVVDAAGTREIGLNADDLALVTLGSMTEDSSLGNMHTAAVPRIPAETGAWRLWRSIAGRHPMFGHPEVFCGDVARSGWLSFTVTLRTPVFFQFMQRFTGNSPGTGGLVTLKDSNWLMSVVLAHQPHFRSQPPDVQIFWGYGLFPERPGNRTAKPMSLCSGAEILDELRFHLPGDPDGGHTTRNPFEQAICIPCSLPFITSQFMPRSAGDRPPVVPTGARNFAFLGQFCELPGDTAFTVEYSVRTAQTAVYALLGLPKRVTPLYRGYLHPLVLARALRALI